MFRTDDAAPHKTDYRLHTPIRIAGAGRLVERKNFPIAIEAVRILNARGRAVHLEVFGDGPDLKGLQELVDRRELAASVRLGGYRQDWSQGALDHDVFVNLSDTEGFCIVVAEAMAAGLPVIATSVGGIREYGRDDENIVALHTADADHLAEQIERLADDEALRRRLGERARLDMIEWHSPSAIQARSQLIFRHSLDTAATGLPGGQAAGPRSLS